MTGAAGVTGTAGAAGEVYPRHREADVVASDGGVVHLRPITPGDAGRLLEFHARLSERTRYLRFFGAYPRIPDEDLKKFTEVDHRDRVAFIGLLGDEIVAVGRYIRIGEAPAAEVAFVVRDDHQSRGLGSILLEHLAAAARESGIERFEAEVLMENRAMLRVFREAGYQVRREFDHGVVHLEFDVDPTEKSLAVRDAREQAAEARSVHNVLHPRSVAVIGASTDPAKIGHAVLANLLRGNFTGPVYPVNSAGPQVRSVRGVRAYPSVIDIPDEVDLAVVAVPAAGIDEVMDSCLAKGVKALVVLSSGFAEMDTDGMVDGRKAQRRLVDAARAHGMRVIGPNALGVANTAAEVSLNATLAPRLPGRGRIGFFCQSGALGIAILAGISDLGLGLSTFVSAGNRADLSGNDLLQYWQTDPTTEVVLLYLETFGNPRKFARLARRLARQKPVVVVKSGRFSTATAPDGGEGGGGRRTRVDDEASVQALFEQAGVIRVQNLAQLFDTALLLANQPLPAGPRVAVVGNSTALGVLVTDALRDEGLVPVGPAVDVGVAASPEVFAEAVAEAVQADDADALVAVYVPPVPTTGGEYARALRKAVAGVGKPVVSTFLAVEGIPDELAVRGPGGQPVRGSVPSYPSPERAVASLARVLRYARWRETPIGDYVRPPEIQRERAAALVEGWGPGELQDAQVSELLACYGIDLVEFRTVGSADEARAAADALGLPVALKGVGQRWQDPDLVGIRLDVGSPEAVERAYLELAEITNRHEVHVQRMAPKGPSCVFEVLEDPSFGAVLSFGLSGIATELLDDRAYHVVPLSTADARGLIRAPRAAPLLNGWGGREPADLEALEELALRLSCMVEDLPEVRTLRLDPVLASPARASVTGARLTLGAPPSRHDEGPRRMG
ncbi:MAG TPA: GNAT family N-acetyltransferase [Pseudonocardia sp.]|nr:GNAT family N-acetyltransferase [Pseudonocardia sp.]